MTETSTVGAESVDGTGADRSAEGLQAFAVAVAVIVLVGFILRLAAQAFVARGWPPETFMRQAILTAVVLAFAVAAWALAARKNVQDKLRFALGAALYVIVVATQLPSDVRSLDLIAFGADASVVAPVVLAYGALVPSPRPFHLGLGILAGLSLPAACVLSWVTGGYGVQTPGGAVLAMGAATSLPTWLGVVVSLRLLQDRLQEEPEEASEEDLAQLGSYTMERKIGEGGMGEVWRAKHAFLPRPAALKLIRAQAIVGGNSVEEAGNRARVLIARFEREAQVTAQLTSAHTVQVYDFGRTGQDLFYYAMELLDGLDLWTLVYKFGPQPEERVHHVLLQACDSVGEAHLHGLIHRDLKPANLMLCKQGMAYDVTKVLDFGLVKSPAALRGEKTETNMRLTQQGMVSGTPAYMSPEQASGQRDLDGRSDLYALACVAYFMLTGFEIFDNPNPIHVMLGQIERMPVPIRERNPRVSLSPSFEAILNRLLAKDREHRYANAAELAEALRACAMPKVWDHEAARSWWIDIYAPAMSTSRPPSRETEDSALPSDERRLLKELRNNRHS